MELNLFVIHNTAASERVPVTIRPATQQDLQKTLQEHWQTSWNSRAAKHFPNKVVLEISSTHELLGLMSYSCDDQFLAVEIVYLESQPQSNANPLHITQQTKRYTGIARAFFAYAVHESLLHGYDGVVVFKAKTDSLLEYYIREFHARPVSRYDPFRLVLWEDAAQELISEYEVKNDE